MNEDLIYDRLAECSVAITQHAHQLGDGIIDQDKLDKVIKQLWAATLALETAGIDQLNLRYVDGCGNEDPHNK